MKKALSTISQFSNVEAADLLRDFKVDPQAGLTQDQVKQLQHQYGLNKVRKQSYLVLRVFFRQVNSSFFVILLVAAALSFFLGEVIDAWMVIAFMLVNTVIGFIQEFHAAQTLQLLEKYTISTTTVRRGGVEQVITTAQLVPGDIVLIQTGDIIPADLRILSSHDLEVDESVLTGESVIISKLAEDQKKIVEKQSEITALNMCLAGTSVVSGKGEGVVVATGAKSTMGEITTIANSTVRPNQLQTYLQKISKVIFLLSFSTILLLFILHFVFKPQQNFVELILFFIALMIGIIPEALPIVMTFAFSRGARVLAEQKVIVKHLNAVEELGNIEVLCSDKTGTLTENQMKVHEVLQVGDLSPAIWALAASKVPYHHTLRAHPEPFDKALLSYVEKERPHHQFSHFELLDSVAFDPHLRTQFAVVKYLHRPMIIVRGAPEVVLEMCHTFAQKKKFQVWEKQNGAQGYRSIAVAYLPIKSLENWQKHISGFSPVGVISFVDPLRESAKSSILDAEKLGVSIKMLTGDSSAVAGYVGKQVGLLTDITEVMHGRVFAELSAQQKKDAVEKYAVFARVNPLQKHEIIQLLQENGHTVGFVGDGINDAPALKQAHVALTVSGASDIAQDAADIILLHRSLSTIVSGIQEGRIIFANVMKYLRLTLSSTFGNFFTVALASLVTAQLPMLPIQILLLNLLSDFPMIGIASDNIDPEELARPIPQDMNRLFRTLLAFGLLSTAFDIFFFTLFFNRPVAVLQTGWFIFSVLTELVFLFTIRTRKSIWRASLPSLLLLFLTVVAATITFFLPFSSVGIAIFHFQRLHWREVCIIGILTFFYLFSNELLKKIPFLRNALSAS